DVEHVGPDKDVDPFGTEDAADFFGNVRVLAGEELWPVLDHGDAAAEAPVRLGEFEADVAAAEDDEVLGQPGELQQLDVRHGTGPRQAGNRWDRAMGPQVEEDAVACQHAGAAVVQTHFERLRRDETPGAHDQFGAAVAVLFQVHGDQ